MRTTHHLPFAQEISRAPAPNTLRIITTAMFSFRELEFTCGRGQDTIRFPMDTKLDVQILVASCSAPLTWGAASREVIGALVRRPDQNLEIRGMGEIHASRRYRSTTRRVFSICRAHRRVLRRRDIVIDPILHSMMVIA